jgi:hypothetical protein
MSVSKVFVSYVDDDVERIERLRRGLANYGIDTWIDRHSLRPGDFWKSVIRNAISNGEYFIACFSLAYNSRRSTYMNEELILAVEELRKRPTHSRWFIPVLLSGEIPDIDIGAGRTLRDIQYVDLGGSSVDTWSRGIAQLAEVVKPGATALTIGASIIDEFIFERPSDYAYSVPLYLSLDPDDYLGELIFPRVADIQDTARKRLITEWTELTAPVKEVLRFLAEHRYVGREAPGGWFESMDSSFARITNVGNVPDGTFESIRWLVRECFDQDNDGRFKVWHVFEAPLREALGIVDVAG